MPKTKGGSGDRGNVFRIGIGDNCDRILAKNGDDGYRHGQQKNFEVFNSVFCCQNSIIRDLAIRSAILIFS